MGREGERGGREGERVGREGEREGGREWGGRERECGEGGRERVGREGESGEGGSKSGIYTSCGPLGWLGGRSTKVSHSKEGRPAE